MLDPLITESVQARLSKEQVKELLEATTAAGKTVILKLDEDGTMANHINRDHQPQAAEVEVPLPTYEDYHRVIEAINKRERKAAKRALALRKSQEQADVVVYGRQTYW